MSNQLLNNQSPTDTGRWLRTYYLVRAIFSFVWVAAVLTVAPASTLVAGALLLIYPAWDAVANVVDAGATAACAAIPPKRSTPLSAA